ncbi:MAG: phosphoribosyl transferase [Bacteroidales bacterium]|nr:phosphoribosyl transferase [Bacteroidales bacterium]
MEYVSIAKLAEIIRRNISRVPRTTDLVVGVPRSGMIPAAIIALSLNLRFTDLDSFVEGHIYGAGHSSESIRHNDYRNILVVDDSIATGRSMDEVKERLKPFEGEYNITYAAILASDVDHPQIDFYMEVIPHPRFFEWNIWRNHVMHSTMVDIDGVLCEDPEIDDDGKEYINFLNTAAPKYIPHLKVDTIISCRLEKYRQPTVNWLSANKVEYNNLVLLDLPDKASRIKWGNHGQWKASHYANSDATLFIESSARQAEIIARLSYKPVFCIETNQLLHTLPQPSLIKRAKRRAKNIMSALCNM